MNRKKLLQAPRYVLELPRKERFSPRRVHRTEIHTVNLLKQLSLPWFLKVLSRYFVCACHVTYIRHHVLIKMDNGVFPGKAPSSACRSSLSAWCMLLLTELSLLSQTTRSWCTWRPPWLFSYLLLKNIQPSPHQAGLQLTQWVQHTGEPLAFQSSALSTVTLGPGVISSREGGFDLFPRALHLLPGLEAAEPLREHETRGLLPESPVTATSTTFQLCLELKAAQNPFLGLNTVIPPCPQTSELTSN